MRETSLHMLLALLLTMTCSIASGSEEDKWTKILFDKSVDMSIKENRMRVATGLQKEITLLKSYIPSLTPSQQKWLENERKSIELLSGEAATTKMFAFSGSNEFLLESFNDGLERIVEGTSCILEKNNNVKRELLCWAYVNYELTNSGTYNDAITRLSHSGFIEFSAPIKKQFMLSYSDDNPWGGYHLMARIIQERLVMFLIRNN